MDNIISTILTYLGLCTIFPILGYSAYLIQKNRYKKNLCTEKDVKSIKTLARLSLATGGMIFISIIARIVLG